MGQSPWLLLLASKIGAQHTKSGASSARARNRNNSNNEPEAVVDNSVLSSTNNVAAVDRHHFTSSGVTCCRNEHRSEDEEGHTVVVISPPSPKHSPQTCPAPAAFENQSLTESFSSSTHSDPPPPYTTRNSDSLPRKVVANTSVTSSISGKKTKEKVPSAVRPSSRFGGLFSQSSPIRLASPAFVKSSTARDNRASTLPAVCTSPNPKQPIDVIMKRTADMALSGTAGAEAKMNGNKDHHQSQSARMATAQTDGCNADNRKTPDKRAAPDQACPLDQVDVTAIAKTGINGFPMATGNGQMPGDIAALKTAITEKVAILDCGAQFGKVIDRRCREKNVLSEMLPLNTPVEKLISDGSYKAIIVSGGPNSVYAPNAPPFDGKIFYCGLPVLGICYGFQLLNRAFGGGVSREAIREDGQTEITVDPECPLFGGLQPNQQVLLTHGDSVTEKTVAPGFRTIANSGGLVAGIASTDPDRKLYGVQFHPEVDLTESGRQMFDNFLYAIAGCRGGYTMENRELMCLNEIRKVAGDDKKVLVMVSGGVDSTVCAALLHRAVGAHRVIAVHIDNGFMRHNESAQVLKSLNALQPSLNVTVAHSRLEFLNGTVTVQGIRSVPLSQCTDPETKRQIIGDTFMRVKDRVMDELNLDTLEMLFAQGTLRPDLIESASALASGHADAIKTHHNDTALVRELRGLGRVIEPLKDFHKDEVRELGEALGLPADIVHRHPFPGPGLAIRILCALKPHICQDFKATQKRLQQIANLWRTRSEDNEAYELIVKFISATERDVLLGAGTNQLIATTLLPVKTVGVQGDSRSYSYVATLSTDLRPIPWSLLERLARLIPRLLHNINRVVYVFGDLVKHSIFDVTPTLLNPITIDQLQRADKAAMDVLFARDSKGRRNASRQPSIGLIQQMPVVLVPVHFDRPIGDCSVRRSICIRPFLTNDFMTGLAALPGRDIPEQLVADLVERIRQETPMLSRVMIDLTSKPPGTTEWE